MLTLRRPTSRARFPRSQGAFTLIEMLCVVGTLTIVFAIVIAVVANARKAAQQPRCLNNLRQIGVGFQLFADANNGRFPDPQRVSTSWEKLLKSYVGSTDVFRCGRDEEVFPAVGSSYDWRDTGKSPTTLAGSDRASVKRIDAVLAFEALSDWHAKGKINAVWVDGSAHIMDREICVKDLTIPVH